MRHVRLLPHHRLEETKRGRGGVLALMDVEEQIGGKNGGEGRGGRGGGGVLALMDVEMDVKRKTRGGV